MLDLAGIKTVLADTGEKAVDLARSNRFHAVLMDLQMPVMDGFEAAGAIRKLENGRHLPIIAMTAHALKEDEARCRAAGMDDYISKPINQEKLFSTLIRHIYREEDPPGRPQATPSPDTLEGHHENLVLPPELPGLDLAGAMAALGVSAPVFVRILDTFLRDIPGVMKGIRSAWLKGDTPGVIRRVHSLKGSASGIGAVNIHKQALAMEALCRRSTSLPDMARAGLPGLEQAVDEVLTAIAPVVPDTQMPATRQEPAQTKPEDLLSILENLASALEYPELAELEALLARLDPLADQGDIDLLKNQIRSHDYDLAKTTVLNLQKKF